MSDRIDRFLQPIDAVVIVKRAARTPVGDLRIETKDWIQRQRVEQLREEGRYRELVLWQLGQPEASDPEANGIFETRAVRMRPRAEPSQADLIAACNESTAPVPQPIIDCILKTQPRKRGPKGPMRSGDDHVTKFDGQVLEFYARTYLEALAANEANERPETRAVKTRAKQRTAKKFGISARTVEGIVAARRLLKSPPK
jgi:hypothetical protein